MKKYILTWKYQDNSDCGIVPVVVEENMMIILETYFFEHLNKNKIFKFVEIKENISLKEIKILSDC